MKFLNKTRHLFLLWSYVSRRVFTSDIHVENMVKVLISIESQTEK
jgi:hypothetical protein